MGDAVARAIGNAGRDHATVAVAEQHDVPKVLVFEHAEHVLDVGVEIV